MSSLIPTLLEIKRNADIYLGSTVVILGTVENILTLLVYSQNSLRSTRTAPYIMLLAVLSTIFLDCNVIPRVYVTIWRQTDTAFGYDVICRLRPVILWSCVTVNMLLLLCLAFDRYLCSCRRASRRAWSTSRVLRNATIAIVSFALLTNWPYLIYCRMAFNPILRSTACTIPDPILLRFYTYFQVLVVYTTLPLLLLLVFGILTIKNIHTTLVTTFALMPYCVQTSQICSEISIADQKTQLHLVMQDLLSVFAMHLYYLLFCSSFYLSLITSKEVRERTKALLLCGRGINNQILPIGRTSRSVKTTSNL